MAQNMVSTKSDFHTRAFERAREAVVALKEARASLSRQELETLGILMDKELLTRLNTSLAEVRAGQVEPLENILD